MNMVARGLWAVSLLATGVFLYAYSYWYFDVILNPDGAYVYAQMREFMMLRFMDAVHVPYFYCGIVEHFFSALLGFFLPLGPSVFLGYFVFIVICFLFARKVFPADRHLAIFALLVFAMVIPFYQFYGARGSHATPVVSLFGFAYLLCRPGARSTGAYSLATVLWCCFWGGFAEYSYSLSRLVFASVVVFLVIDTAFQIRAIASSGSSKSYGSRLEVLRKLVLAPLAYVIGFAPYWVSIAFYKDRHTFPSPTKISLDPEHLLGKARSFVDVIGHMFTPVFEHTLVMDGRTVNHFYEPMDDVITHISSAGYLIGFASLALFFVMTVRRLLSSGSIERKLLTAFLLLNALAMIAGYHIRGEVIVPWHETRFMLVLYFSVVVGCVYLLPRRAAYVYAVLLVGISIFSHYVVLEKNLRWTVVMGKSERCDSMTRSEVAQVLSRMKPEAMAGYYEVVWPFASYQNQNIVYGHDKNKFRHSNEELSQRRIVWIEPISPRDSVRNMIENYVPGDRRFSDFERVDTRFYRFFFERYDSPEAWQTYLASRELPDSGNWGDLYRKIAQEMGKTECE